MTLPVSINTPYKTKKRPAGSQLLTIIHGEMKSLLLILAVLVISANALFGSSTPSSCRGKTVPIKKCAVLFDDDNCGGWQVNIQEPKLKSQG